MDGRMDGWMDGWMDGFSVLLMYSTVQHVGGFGIFRCSQRAVDPLCRDNEQRPSHRSFVYHSPKRQNPGINPPRCHASFRVTAPVPSPDDDIYCHIHCEVYELRRHSNSENRPCLNMTWALHILPVLLLIKPWGIQTRTLRNTRPTFWLIPFVSRW